MKKHILLLLFSLISLITFAQNKDYDAALAKKLNADEYGMKKYVLVMLKKGSNVSTDKTERNSAFGGHMKNIARLAADNKLALAGPMSENEKYEGIFILNCDTIDEAKALTETDPAIKEKFLEAEYYQWYGTAALQETTNIHKKLAKNSY